MALILACTVLSPLHVFFCFQGTCSSFTHGTFQVNTWQNICESILTKFSQQCLLTKCFVNGSSLKILLASSNCCCFILLTKFVVSFKSCCVIPLTEFAKIKILLSLKQNTNVPWFLPRSILKQWFMFGRRHGSQNSSMSPRRVINLWYQLLGTWMRPVLVRIVKTGGAFTP